MKVILHMGVSINGYIAKENGNSEWTSDENLTNFFDHAKKAGNIVMGKNTFIEASKYGYFPFPGCLNVVLTHEPIDNKWGDAVTFVNLSPSEVLEMLEKKGFTKAFLAGGGIVNSQFMRAKLIDEFYIDIEPLVFGKGIPVFKEEDFEFELELLETKQINKNTIQLHYMVIK